MSGRIHNPVNSALMRHVVTAILECAKERGISERELAGACNVSPSYWSVARGRSSGLSMYVFMRACAYLEAAPAEMLPTLDQWAKLRQTALGT